ncbi:MAG: hypothetical protein QOE33_685 [Acidobacteriota bacterium]|nr:hypothetical protein [Acidobacteriota bacterium]
MASKKAQGKAGVAATRRGQQMGDSRSTNTPAKQEQANAPAPTARGRRQDANKFFADDSAQQPGSDATTPRSNSPSTPAALPSTKKLGESGGEKVFKQQQAKKRGRR